MKDIHEMFLSFSKGFVRETSLGIHKKLRKENISFGFLISKVIISNKSCLPSI